MGRAVRLWQRDYEILDELRHGFHSTSQIARLYFPALKKGSERMKLLFEAELVGRFPKPTLEMRGKPEFVYCAKGKAHRRRDSWASHALAITEFKVRFLLWVRSQTEFSGQFFYPSQLQNKSDNLIPDGVFVVRRNGKALLYFLEVDLGTEAFAGNGYAFGDKLDAYGDYFDRGEYVKDFDALGTFRGFRVAVVFDSEKRLENFRSIAELKGADFVLLSTFERLKPETFSDRVWFACDGEMVSLVGKQGI